MDQRHASLVASQPLLLPVHPYGLIPPSMRILPHYHGYSPGGSLSKQKSEIPGNSQNQNSSQTQLLLFLHVLLHNQLMPRLARLLYQMKVVSTRKILPLEERISGYRRIEA